MSLVAGGMRDEIAQRGAGSRAKKPRSLPSMWVMSCELERLKTLLNNLIRWAVLTSNSSLTRMLILRPSMST